MFFDRTLKCSKKYSDCGNCIMPKKLTRFKSVVRKTKSTLKMFCDKTQLLLGTRSSAAIHRSTKIFSKKVTCSSDVLWSARAYFVACREKENSSTRLNFSSL